MAKAHDLIKRLGLALTHVGAMCKTHWSHWTDRTCSGLSWLMDDLAPRCVQKNFPWVRWPAARADQPNQPACSDPSTAPNDEASQAEQLETDNAGITPCDLEYVNDCRSAIMSHSAAVTTRFLFSVTLCLIVLVTWAHFAIVDEVTHAEGKVVPSSSIRTIQNLEGGILDDMKVREGQTVTQGQTLLVIDDTRFASKYREESARHLSLLASIARLKAEVDGADHIVFPKAVKGDDHLVQAETNLFKARQLKHHRTKESLENSYRYTQRELDITRPLVKEGVMSKIELLRLEREVNELKGRIADHDNAFRQEALDELAKKQTQAAASKEALANYKDQMARTVIHSPVTGIIKQVHITTKGGIIQPGMDIMEIVPLEDNLLVEAKIRPADVGFIHPGQAATVKISAYDFSIYGGLDGKVERIAADTITDDRGESFYEIYVRTNQNYLEKGPKKLHIIPGMVANVDILTGRKSVLSYLLKPVLKVKQAALRER